MATGDYVRFNHQGTVAHGYGTISNQKVALTKPAWRSIQTSKAQVVERSHGYQVQYPTATL